MCPKRHRDHQDKHVEKRQGKFQAGKGRRRYQKEVTSGGKQGANRYRRMEPRTWGGFKMGVRNIRTGKAWRAQLGRRGADGKKGKRGKKAGPIKLNSAQKKRVRECLLVNQKLSEKSRHHSLIRHRVKPNTIHCTAKDQL